VDELEETGKRAPLEREREGERKGKGEGQLLGPKPSRRGMKKQSPRKSWKSFLP